MATIAETWTAKGRGLDDAELAESIANLERTITALQPWRNNPTSTAYSMTAAALGALLREQTRRLAARRQHEETAMGYDDALETARHAAVVMDGPAWVYREGDTFQVVAWRWEKVTAGMRESIVAVALPDGQVLERPRIRV
jgi:gentisate 1,2-dioxygenase